MIQKLVLVLVHISCSIGKIAYNNTLQRPKKWHYFSQNSLKHHFKHVQS